MAGRGPQTALHLYPTDDFISGRGLMLGWAWIEDHEPRGRGAFEFSALCGVTVSLPSAEWPGGTPDTTICAGCVERAPEAHELMEANPKLTLRDLFR